METGEHEHEPDAPAGLAEAEPAEAEPAEAEPAEAEPAEAEPAEAEPDSGPSSQAILRALEREENRHRKSLAKALDVDEETLHECPTCQAMGYTPDAIEPEPELVQDPYTETCTRCMGNGVTRSGATTRGLYEIPCGGCGGTGYVQHVEQPEAGAGFGNGAPAEAAARGSFPSTPADAAALAELRARGYTIVEPITVPAQPAT